MDVTVAIVTYNAAWCIGDCLQRLIGLDDHGGALEILVVDGQSADDTARIARGFEGVRVVNNPGRTIASNRNVALREASHPFVAFTDSDCLVPPHWLAGLCRAWRDLAARHDGLAGVGGGNHPPLPGNPWEQALALMLDSWLGSLGSVQGRRWVEVQPVPSIACLNALYDRETLLSIGGFDEGLRNMCEDADLNFRLRQKGYRLYYAPGVEVTHNARDQKSLLAWAAKMRAYGMGRARLMRKHRTGFSPGLLMAAGFWPALLLAGLAAPLWPWTLLVWAYFPLAWLYAFLISRATGKSGLGPRTALMFNVTHMCYGWGLLRGLIWLGKP